MLALLLGRNYAKNYASVIYKGLVWLRRFFIAVCLACQRVERDWLAPIGRNIYILLDILVRSIAVYNMDSSVSGQDKPNPVLWLAYRAGKMERSCPLGITRFVSQEKFLWNSV